MTRTKRWVVATGTSLLLGAVFYGDAREYALSKNEPGRENGCYTILDDLLNAHSTADFPWTRGVEEQLATVLFCISAATGLAAAGSAYWMRRRLSPAATGNSRIENPQ